MDEGKAIKRALYVTKVKNLECYDENFSRIYFGCEFCQRLLPSVKNLQQVLEFVSEKNLDFTFITPYVTNDGLKKLDALLQIIENNNPGSEVVFNDWGVFNLLGEKYKNLEPVMGRLLNKMKRGPRLKDLMGIMPQSTADYFRTCSLDSPLYRKFLADNGIKRVELDNLLQGIDLDLGDSAINTSLYVPYAFITTTRLCLAISCDVSGKEDEIGIFPCKEECQKYTFQHVHSIMPVPLISRGNTMFFKNENIPSEDILAKNHVDRIVIEPDVPV
ncbi:MAG: hypothetical protein FP814_14715 [Desulfobacterium sp.]|nr:hypothetical protein [Desulfobacterium sp.]MBU3947088.1 hypothetical protein [Pseudomonadota bacterium]MBU4035394.1 hypothetical protein [Pseudomonadota bacterium]